MVNKRLLFGSLAAACTAAIPLQAVGERMDWPFLTKLFDGDVKAAVGLMYGVTAVGVGVFGFLAANANGHKDEAKS